MVVVPLTQPTKNLDAASHASGIEVADWTRVAAAGAIVTGGLLLLVGWRRAGMLTAAAGTVLTMLDQQETIRSWWSVIPGYIDDVQRVLNQVESTVDDIEAKRESLRDILSKHAPAEQPFGNS
ncbi:MAG: hypothetical protein ABSF28_14160 [Terracidiphilus sp.]|jgi:hypothetical protein